MTYDTIRSFINDSLINYETTERWSSSFRGSSLPLCPRRLMLGEFQKRSGPIERRTGFVTQYNYQVGRSIHALAQETFAKQGLLWGDWRCKDAGNCGVKFTNTRLEGGKCIRCGEPCLYIEKKVTEQESKFSGHVDAPVFCPSMDAYLIFELKSRNSNIISASSEPYQSDLYQVSMYATLLHRTYWMRVAGRVILWIGKPKPKPFKFWFYPGIGEELADEQFKAKKDLDLKMKEGRVLEVEGICNGIDNDDGCPYVGICSSPVMNRLIMTEYEEFLNWQK